MDENEMSELLQKQIEWMERVYQTAKSLPTYQWVPVKGVTHRCGGEIFAYVETTGIGYVCVKCRAAEVL